MNKIDKIFCILESELSKLDPPVIDVIYKDTKDPFKVLVGTLISSRTKDNVTFLASKKLFKILKSSKDISKLSLKEIEELIYPVGFYKTKAKNIKKLCKSLNDDFNSIVPDNIEDLVSLSGVGRKTANLVLSVAFDKYSICVDTHVHRILNRLGYLKTKTPLETEMFLRKNLKKKYWKKINYYLVLFGQNICKPISPKCSTCPVAKYCDKII